MLKIMTYNIRGGRGMDGTTDLKRIADIINDEHPDFLCLNEVDMFCSRSDFRNTMEEMKQGTGMEGFFISALQLDPPAGPGAPAGEYGIAMLSPHPMTLIKKFFLPLPADMEPRVCAIAKVDAPHPFFAVITHLSDNIVNSPFRCDAVKVINQETATYGESDLPVILCGDMNALPDSPEIAILKEEWLLHGNGNNFPPTYPSDTPEIAIDYIGVRPKTSCQFSSMRVIPEKVASDHRPLLVELDKA